MTTEIIDENPFFRVGIQMEAKGYGSRSTQLRNVDKGILTPPIHRGPKIVGWTQRMLDINDARLEQESLMQHMKKQVAHRASG